MAHYQRTATTITSDGNRNPANADLGGSHGPGRVDDLTARACLDLANAQCNGALKTMLDQARTEARLDGSTTVEAQHLLLGIAADPGSAAGRVLASAGLDLK